MICIVQPCLAAATSHAAGISGSWAQAGTFSITAASSLTSGSLSVLRISTAIQAARSAAPSRRALASENFVHGKPAIKNLQEPVFLHSSAMSNGVDPYAHWPCVRSTEHPPLELERVFADLRAAYQRLVPELGKGLRKFMVPLQCSYVSSRRPLLRGGDNALAPGLDFPLSLAILHRIITIL